MNKTRSWRGTLEWCLIHNSQLAADQTPKRCLWDAYQGNRPARAACVWTTAEISWAKEVTDELV